MIRRLQIFGKFILYLIMACAISIPLLLSGNNGITEASNDGPKYDLGDLGPTFTIAVMPDTQFYSESLPKVFNAQTQWIADNYVLGNIAFALHEGDIVNMPKQSKQWNNAVIAMNLLGDTPYLITPGNHDDDGGYKTFQQYFGNLNSFLLFEANGQKFMVVSINYDPDYFNETTGWTNQILETFPDRDVIILTHAYINNKGSKIREKNVSSGIYLWNNIIRPHKNIFLVLCGHICGEAVSVDIGDNGNVIHNILADYQGLSKNKSATGYLRLLTFNIEVNTISVKTYSPYLNKFRVQKTSQFEIPMN